MSDLPRRVLIQEEGPREGFQIEPKAIPVADKVRFIEALAETGLTKIDCVSFVNPEAGADDGRRRGGRRRDHQA